MQAPDTRAGELAESEDLQGAGAAVLWPPLSGGFPSLIPGLCLHTSFSGTRLSSSGERALDGEFSLT